MLDSGDTRDDVMIRLALLGDVMTGRGIDQILPHPSQPVLHEPYVQDARDYVTLAEQVHGSIETPVDYAYIWGDALEELQEVASPDARIVNLETSITQSDDPWREKSIHYRMHPDNVPCLTAAGIDCCSLANNHVLDWGYEGLFETLEKLSNAGIATAGAGRQLREAAAPAILDVPEKGRILVFACGAQSSGIPLSWAATEDRPGVNLLPDLSAETANLIGGRVQRAKKENDVVVLSIHWGGNWGYRVSSREIDFVHRLVEDAGVDLVHGHSSHHVKAVEVHEGRPILYGCGDFIDDYEGISGYESYRDDLGLIYLPTLDSSSGRLSRFDMIPTRIRRLRVNRAHGKDVQWLYRVLNREGESFDTGARLNEDETLSLEWQNGPGNSGP